MYHVVFPKISHNLAWDGYNLVPKNVTNGTENQHAYGTCKILPYFIANLCNIPIITSEIMIRVTIANLFPSYPLISKEPLLWILFPLSTCLNKISSALPLWCRRLRWQPSSCPFHL